MSLGLVFLVNGVCRASRRLHRALLNNVLRSSATRFDIIPVGRLINRFSQDMYTIDYHIRFNLDIWFKCIFHALVSVSVISYSTPFVVVPLVPLAAFYFAVQVQKGALV